MRNLLLSLFLSISTTTYAQSSFEDMRNMYCAIDVEAKTVEMPYNSIKTSMPLERLVSLLENDLFGYFDIADKFKTNLQKSAYAKTPEYAELNAEFSQRNKEMKDATFYIPFNLRYNKPYDTTNKRFAFSIGATDYDITNLQGYIGFGNNVCTTYPTSRMTRSKTRTRDGLHYYISDFVQTPKVSEELALRIEKDMDNPYCETCLVFVVKMNKVSKENRTINFGGYVGTMATTQHYLLAKTIGLYIVNMESNEIYCDLSSILSTPTTQTKKTSPQNGKKTTQLKK